MRSQLRTIVTTVAAALLVSASIAAAPTAGGSMGDDALGEFRNNVAVSYGPGTGADFDGAGFAYSQFFYTESGSLVAAGQTFEVDGVTFTWPSAAAGEADNIESDGQLIPIAAAPGASKLGLMGMGHNGSGPAALLLNYEDSTQEKVFAQLADWWDAFTYSVPNNTLVAHNLAGVISDTIHVPLGLGVYATTVPVDPSRTLVSVQLSKNSGQHYLDIQVDQPA